jgi:hypothetical protein
LHGEHGDCPDVATSAQLARLLHTTSRQVHAWYSRRDRNDFPEPIGCSWRAEGGGPRGGPLHDAAAVMAWWVDYDPRWSGMHRYDSAGRHDRVLALAATGMVHREIAAQVGLSRSMVSKIVRTARTPDRVTSH